MPFAPDTEIQYPGVYNGMKFVAVIGWVNDFAVYCGASSQPRDEIASNGDKISEDIARHLFPEMKKYGYRL